MSCRHSPGLDHGVYRRLRADRRLRNAALVSRHGSIDWLCFPRFDSPACFAALVDHPEHGRWLLAPSDTSHRRHVGTYRGDTPVLETEFTTADGVVAVLDFMPVRSLAVPMSSVSSLADAVTVRMQMDLADSLRLRQHRPLGALVPTAAFQPSAAGQPVPSTPVSLRARSSTRLPSSSSRRESGCPSISPGFHRTSLPSCELDPEEAFEQTKAWWTAWAGRCTAPRDRGETPLCVL